MLYMQGDGGNLKIIVLETGNLEEMRKGRPVRTPDGTVLIAWTPDPVWLADKIMGTGGDALAIGRLIDEAAKRPQKPTDRPKHETHVTDFRAGQQQEEPNGDAEDDPLKPDLGGSG